MANPEHLAKLNEGVEAWNKWREENKEVVPDLFDAYLAGRNLQNINLTNANLSEATLSEADLSKAYLADAELVGTDLTNAVLSGADITDSNLSGADLTSALLNSADLSGADLSRATLKKAKLEGTNLPWAKLFWTDFSEANLSKANLREAKLSWAVLLSANLTNADLSKSDLAYANLTNAHLSGAELKKARLKNTSFSSRAVLNNLSNPLNEEQLEGAAFFDEERFFKKEDTQFYNHAFLPRLRFEFLDKNAWTPLYLGMVMVAAQTSYNKLFYLLTTQEKDSEAIESMLDKSDVFLGINDDIRVERVSLNSPLSFDLAPLVQDPESFKTTCEGIAVVLPALGELVKNSLYGAAAVLTPILTARHLKNKHSSDVAIPDNHHEINPTEAENIYTEIENSPELNKAITELPVGNPVVQNKKHFFLKALRPFTSLIYRLAKINKIKIKVSVNPPPLSAENGNSREQNNKTMLPSEE